MQPRLRPCADPPCPPRPLLCPSCLLQAALQLYTRSGFRQLGEELPPADDGQGRRLLLCRSLEEGGSSAGGGDLPVAASDAPAAADDAPEAAPQPPPPADS